MEVNCYVFSVDLVTDVFFLVSSRTICRLVRFRIKNWGRVSLTRFMSWLSSVWLWWMTEKYPSYSVTTEYGLNYSRCRGVPTVTHTFTNKLVGNK